MDPYFPCPGPEPCNHTAMEHAAFDMGFEAGERGDDEETCPIDDDELREAWLTGHSVGYCGAMARQEPHGDTNGGQDVL